jgi:hypothetical protein
MLLQRGRITAEQFEEFRSYLLDTFRKRFEGV